MSVNATFQVIVEPEGGVFVTYVPALGFASTHGATRAEALERTRELIVGYLEAAEREGIPVEIPPPNHHAEIVELPISA